MKNENTTFFDIEARHKRLASMRIIENVKISELYSLLVLTNNDGSSLPDMLPGQFVQIAVPDAPHTFLRRPISVCMHDKQNNTLWLLIRRAGEGTSKLCDMKAGCILSVILPLGKGFGMPGKQSEKLLLIGGGVGVAPLLYLGRCLAERGFNPEFLLGARSGKDLLLLDEFKKYGVVHTSTDDGSCGEHGVVTQHSRCSEPFDRIYCCGPAPMMKAVAKVAKSQNAWCEVSLENMMACGVGACLCCVEKTVRGNVCVCTEGPVFNINELTWCYGKS